MFTVPETDIYIHHRAPDIDPGHLFLSLGTTVDHTRLGEFERFGQGLDAMPSILK